MIRTRLPAATLVLGGLAVLVVGGAFAADPILGRDVTLMTARHDAAEIEEWRRLRDPIDDPAEIYGRPQPRSTRRVAWAPWGAGPDLVPIPEAPGRLMLFVDEPPVRHLYDPRALRSPATLVGVLLLALGLGVYARSRLSSGSRSPR